MAHDTQVTVLEAMKDEHRVRVLYSASRGLVLKESLTDGGRVDFRDRKAGDLRTYRATIKSVQRGGYRIVDTDQVDLVPAAPSKSPVVAEDGEGGWAWICPVEGCPAPYGAAYTETAATVRAGMHQKRH